MNKLLLVLMGLVALIGLEPTTTAHPCRPGFPNCRGPHRPPPPPPPVVTTIYQRALPAPPPVYLDRATLVRLLAGSAWTRLGSREQIRFVEPPTGHFAQPPEAPAGRDRAIRAVAIDLVRDRRSVLVNIDGALYTIAACQMPRPAGPRPAAVITTCLEHHDAGGAFGGDGYGGVTYGGR